MSMDFRSCSSRTMGKGNRKNTSPGWKRKQYDHGIHSFGNDDPANNHRTYGICTQAVPTQYYEGAVALGGTHERAIFTVVLPAAKSGVVAAIVLGIGRAIGETMAVIMVAGNQRECRKESSEESEH